MRYDLTDFEWSVIEPLLPTKGRGVKPKKNRRHVQREARRVLTEVKRAQRCLARCLAPDETKATEAEIRNMRQQSTPVVRMIEAFNLAKSDAELSVAMQLVVKLTAVEVPGIRWCSKDIAPIEVRITKDEKEFEGASTGDRSAPAASDQLETSAASVE
jgi:hypothetical protein